ncbi:MAG: VirB8/TrbF family protein [Gammaproteobacteria bacterium]|nr:VirB8/TrbF family protein [Gammaproteobacteria bacterium]
MSKSSPYYKTANDWNYDVYESALVTRNRYYFLSILFGLIALASVLAVAALLPLKEKEPYLLERDSSGMVREVRPLDMTQYTPNEAMIEYFVSRYILARERVDARDLESRHKEVQALSDVEASNEYVHWIKKSPRSPLRTYKQGETRTVYITALNHLNKKAVHVEFETTDNLHKTTKKRYWAAVLDFEFVNLPDDSEFRFDNPLGFQVTKYRKNQKVIKGREIEQ